MWFRPRLLSLLAAPLAAACATYPGPPVEEVSLGAARASRPAARPSRDPALGGALSGRAAIPQGVLAKATKLISDNGYGVVSNQGGAVVANNGGQVVANNGGQAIAAPFQLLAPYTLMAAGQRALIGFPVRIVDAQGAPVLDAAGKPYEAATDRLGRYAFRATPRGRNLLVELALPGDLGTMRAFLPDAAAGAPRTADVEGVGTHVLGYVLATYVKADQARLDRLEADAEAAARAEAEKALAAVAKGVIDADSVAEAALVKTVGVWRELSEPFDASLAAIEAKVAAPQ